MMCYVLFVIAVSLVAVSVQFGCVLLMDAGN